MFSDPHVASFRHHFVTSICHSSGPLLKRFWDVHDALFQRPCWSNSLPPWISQHIWFTIQNAADCNFISIVSDTSLSPWSVTQRDYFWRGFGKGFGMSMMLRFRSHFVPSTLALALAFALVTSSKLQKSRAWWRSSGKPSQRISSLRIECLLSKLDMYFLWEIHAFCSHGPFKNAFCMSLNFSSPTSYGTIFHV